MTISPSITQRSGNSAMAAATNSGKYRVIGFSLRLPTSTWSPSRKRIDLNPSHLGSYDASGGIDFTDLASIGETGGITGKSICTLCCNPVLESGDGIASGGNRRRRHRGSADQPGQGVLPEAGIRRHQATARRVLPRRGGGPDAGPVARPPDASAALSRRHRWRGDLPEAHPATPPRLPGDLPDHVPVGTDRRRTAGDPPRRDRMGRADGHHHAAPMAGSLP